MASHLRSHGDEGQGIGHAFQEGGAGTLGTYIGMSNDKTHEHGGGEAGLELTNRAGESKSPYVRGHAGNPVAWQTWGSEAIALAKRENRLLFVSIGYSACHWCHVMEKESFENEEVAALLNSEFIPMKVDREERPDIDRIYMNFVQATTGSGGWPLNVFVTPDLEPVFGGTYWPGPTSHPPSLEEQLDFLGILNKLSTVWREQEARCRLDATQIMTELRKFAAEGTFGERLGVESSGLDLDLVEEATQHVMETYDTLNGGFGAAPKFPTPSKLSFLLRLSQYPHEIIDIVGAATCLGAQQMAIMTLRKMARGGIHDHVGHGFARYSVTADWSLPHFEKMLYDNVQLLHIYLDAFLLSRDPELLGAVYDIATYLTTTLARPSGGFYSSEDADSYYRSSDTEKREGAFYVWTKREFENVLGRQAEPVLSAFFNVRSHGNVAPENDVHDEFIDQNVLAVVGTPSTLAAQFGMKEEEVVRIIKEGKEELRRHRDKERVRPALDDKIVVAWNGIAIGALARTGAVIQTFDKGKGEEYLKSAIDTAAFLREEMWDDEAKILYRVWREGRGDIRGFADDYAFLIDGLLDLYESTFDEEYLRWADDLQRAQISYFHDPHQGAFFSTPSISSAPDLILRLKDGMDTSEPSTNGTSSSNLWRLHLALNDAEYKARAEDTLTAFESEILQYPWLFGSFMGSVVAARLGGRTVVVCVGSKGLDDNAKRRIAEAQARPRGGLGSLVIVREGEGVAGWLKERNPLFGSLKTGKEGRCRGFVCEGAVCTEDGADDVVEGMSGLGFGSEGDVPGR